MRPPPGPGLHLDIFAHPDKHNSHRNDNIAGFVVFGAILALFFAILGKRTYV